MEDLTVGIKVECDPVPAQCIKVLRDILDLSISEIKTRIINNEYVFVGDSAEDETIDTIIKIYEKLSAVNINCVVYEFDEPSDIQIIYNMRESYDAINKQVDSEPWD